MKFNRSKLIKLATSGSAGLALACTLVQSVQAETVLDYTGAPGKVGTFGSNATGTPNISLSATTGLEGYANWDGRGDVAQTDYNQEGDSEITITFTPDPEFGVLITSFDLDEWVGGGDSSLDWKITGGSVNLSGTWDDFNSANDPSDLGGRTTGISTGMTTGQAQANIGIPMVLSFTLTGGRPNYLALDNLAFDQVTGSPPSITSIQHETATDRLTIKWESEAGKVYDLLSHMDLSIDPATWPVVSEQEGLAATPPENNLSIPRPSDGTRFYVIREENAPPPPPLFFDDFESVPDPDWSTGANLGDTGGTVWERGAPVADLGGGAFGPATGANGSATCYGTNLTDIYGSDTDIYLRSPAIDLTSLSGSDTATLTLQYFVDTDLAVVDPDRGMIRVLDASNLGQQLGADLTGNDGLGTINSGWTTFSEPLPAEALGKTIILEFQFTSNNTDNFGGFYIDDVTVTSP